MLEIVCQPNGRLNAVPELIDDFVFCVVETIADSNRMMASRAIGRDTLFPDGNRGFGIVAEDRLQGLRGGLEYIHVTIHDGSGGHRVIMWGTCMACVA